jgi:hypothetical protein
MADLVEHSIPGRFDSLMLTHTLVADVKEAPAVQVSW